MPALTGMMDMLGLGKLFKKAEAGDPEARRVVMNLNKMPSVTGQAFGAPAEMELPGLATEQTILGGRQGGSLAAVPSTRTPGTSGEAGGGGVEVKNENKPNRWKQASILASDIARGLQDPRFRTTGGLADKFRAEQSEALKRRHAMWDNTYEIAQSLPQEILTDPRFSALAQAKAAFDKDMMDGKIDNEKSVSGFLTELSRHKRDIEEVGMQAKLQQQLALESGLKQGRIGAGLAPPETEVNLGGTKFNMSAPEAFKMEEDRLRQTQQDFERGQDRKRDDALRRLQFSDIAENRRVAQEDRDLGRQRLERGTTLRGTQELIESDIKRGLQPDPMNPGKLEQPTEAHLLKAVMQNKDAILEAGQRMGLKMQEPNYVTRTPGVYTIQGKAFTPEEMPSMLMFIYRMMHTQG